LKEEKIMTLQIRSLARAVAAVFWADEKDTPEEWASAEHLFVENGCDWEAAKALIEEEIEDLIDERDSEEDEEEAEDDLFFGVIDLGPGADPFKIFCGLAEISCSDKRLTWEEIGVLHILGDAMNVPREIVTAAVARAANSSGVMVELEGDD
jgi:hypothetical protein